MEITFSHIAVIAFFTLIIYIIDKKVYRKIPNEQGIKEYQKKLDLENKRFKEYYGFEFKRDALETIKQANAVKRGFIFIFFGIGLAFSAVIFVLVSGSSPLESPLTLILLLLTAVFMLLYGLIEMAVDKKFALKLVLIIITFSVIVFSGLTWI